MVRKSCVAIFAASVLLSSPAAAQSGASGIEFSSVADALKALKAKPGVKFSSNDGWTVAEDADGAMWSFTPASHFANPSVGRRTLQQRQGQFFVQTQILCQAQKPACDKLKADYELLDKRMMEAINKKK